MPGTKLKRAIRARMVRTGETYSTARAALLRGSGDLLLDALSATDNTPETDGAKEKRTED